MDKLNDSIKVKDAAFNTGMMIGAGFRHREAERAFRIGSKWTRDAIDWEKVKKEFQEWQIKQFGYNTAIDMRSNEIFDHFKKQIEGSWLDKKK